MKKFYEEILNDFSFDLYLDVEDVMILEALSFALKEIEEDTILSPKYYLLYNNLDVLNMFKDEVEENLVNPIEHYGLDIIKNSKLLDVFKSIRLEYSNISENLTNQQEIFRKVLKIVLKDSNIECKKYLLKYKNYVENYYCSSEYNNITNTCVNIEKEEQRKIINYMLNNYENTRDIDFSKSFYTFRETTEKENLRNSIVNYLQNENKIGNYTDRVCIVEGYPKTSFAESLYLLFSYIYEEVTHESFIDAFDLFKKNIITNYKLRKLFFDVIEVLLKNPKNKRIKIKTLIDNY